MPFRLQIGHGLIDLENPKPEQIDLPEIERRLRVMYRWSNNPDALTVHQHRKLVPLIAKVDSMRLRGYPFSTQVLDWCEHHDDHEGITGDMPGPLKNLVTRYTPAYFEVENRLDRAICAARGVPYPGEGIRRTVHYYDKAAETIEWVFVMGNPVADWNYLTPDWTMDPALIVPLIDEARAA